MKYFIIFLQVFILLSCATHTQQQDLREPASKKYPLLKAPSSCANCRFSYPPTSRTVSIADLHGDFDAFIKILISRKIINKDGKWIAGDTRLVMLGDLLDRGDQGRQILCYLMQLEKDAKAAGGMVHTLLGNHELLVMSGDHRYVSAKDAINFFKPDFKYSAKKAFKEYKQFMTTDNAITAWLREKPVLIRIGNSLFAHGGLEDWVGDVNPRDLNYTMNKWAEYYTQVSKKPADKTGWVVDEEGPMWTRKMAQGEVSAQNVSKILSTYRAKRMILGHTLQDSGVNVIYDGKIVLSDTGISSVYQGELSSVAIDHLRGNKLDIKSFVRPGRNEFSKVFENKFDLKFSSCTRVSLK